MSASDNQQSNQNSNGPGQFYGNQIRDFIQNHSNTNSTSSQSGFRGGIWNRGGGPEWHHDRNLNQSCPVNCQDIFENPQDWYNEGNSSTHGGFNSFRGRTNENEGYQCVYDSDCYENSFGNLITDPDYEGTYDYSPPLKFNDDGSVNYGKSLVPIIEHFFEDVYPWILYGN